jgi:hypothetical protein
MGAYNRFDGKELGLSLYYKYRIHHIDRRLAWLENDQINLNFVYAKKHSILLKV